MSTVIDKSGSRAKLEASKNTAKFATRNANARVWALETEIDEKYARTQRRYLGTSGNVEHTDPNALMGAHFTLTSSSPQDINSRCTTTTRRKSFSFCRDVRR